MKYLSFLILFVLLTSQAYSQNINFTLADPQPVIMEVHSGILLHGDLDNDGDIDLVQSGVGVDMMGLAAKVSVFLNDGIGNFTLKEQEFNDFFGTEQVAMGDLDNDNDLDIIVTAINRSDFYRNDGSGNFIYDDSAPFQASDISRFIIGDVDGNGTNDVLQFSRENSITPFVNLYMNDGSGNFTIKQDLNFTPLLNATTEFIDLEGDGDKDVLSFGENSQAGVQIFVYENDGQGNFSVFSNSNITPLLADEIGVGDIDNDGDDDFLITGTNSASVAQTKLYINDGDGQFSELADTPFPDVFASSNSLADFDNDNDLDVLIVGSMQGGLPNIFTIVFENLGNNQFLASDSLGGEYISKNIVADFNGDDKKDIIIQGFIDKTNVYWNETMISSVSTINEIPLSIYPNPSKGEFVVEWDDEEFDRVEINDAQGRLVSTGMVIQQGIHHVQLNSPAGIYVLKLSGENKVSSQRIIVIE